MPKRSAGILAYRFNDLAIEVLLAHPGGPFFSKKDIGVWSIPKGEYEPHENALEVAKREFEEETGNVITVHSFVELSPVKVSSGKIVSVWAVEQNFEPSFIRSNTFEMEWPPKSGKMQTFPEVDRAGWFTIEMAQQKLVPSQVPIINELSFLLFQK